MSIVQINKNMLTKTIKEIVMSEKGLKTGYKVLDERINGLQKGAFYVLGGRPAMGKTTFAMNIAYHLAVKQNKKVLYVSFDMSKRRVITRLLRMDCGIDLERLQGKLINEQLMQKLSTSINHLGQAPICLEDAPGFTVEALVMALRDNMELNKVQLVVIDYLQLMSCDREFETRQEEISYICLQLKNIAKELNISIMAISALSRAVEQRPDHRPLLSDLRESGGIEQYADVVMFLYREEYYDAEPISKGNTEIIVSKNLYGPIGIVKLTFSDKYMLYKE